MVGLLEPFTEVSQKEKQQHIEDLKTKCPYCGKPLVRAMENTVSFGDAVPIPNAVSRAMLNNLSICCINGFCFYNLNPLVVPSHTPIGLFDNQ